jgi:carbon monoxide dehydrogenase subunit G
MRIENVVEVDAPVDRVWALVNDIPRVAPCMPGAALTGVVDERTYEGTVAVKLGPLRMSYKGTVVIEEVDEAARSARLAASGKDTKGAGTARASVETRLEPAGEARTRLAVTSDVQLTGRVASFGRGGAINDVATRLFREFADCLRATLEAEQAPAAAAPPAAAPAEAGAGAGTPGAPAAEGAAAPAGPAAGEAAPGEAPAPAAPAAAETPAATVTPSAAPVHATPAQAPRPLDAGSLAGTVVMGRLRAFFQAIAGFFRRLFGRGSRA